MGSWTKHYGPRGNGLVRLLCFHYAGGTASTFREWPALLPSTVEPIAVQLPGRDERHAEAPHTDMRALADDVVRELEPLLDRPFACLGLSMGARVSLEFAHALRDSGRPQPTRLFVASSSAPALRLPVRGWSEPDSGLVAYLRDLGGTSSALFDDPDLLELFLPVLRADLTVIGTWTPPPRDRLALPIRAFAGADDTTAPADLMRPWRAETTGDFQLDTVDGGHFFSAKGTRTMLDRVAADLVGADLAR